MKCPTCHCEASPHLTLCHVCQSHLGFPNVRSASEPQETNELDRRYTDARASAKKRGVEAQLTDFEDAVDTRSQAVMAKRWETLFLVLRNQVHIYGTLKEENVEFYRLPKPQKKHHYAEWLCLKDQLEAAGATEATP